MAKKPSGPKQVTRKRYLRGTDVLVERVIRITNGARKTAWRTFPHGIYVHVQDTELRGSTVMPTT